MFLLDEKKYKSLPESTKVLYLLQWLQNLPMEVKEVERVELKSKQKALVSQLQSLLYHGLGPPLQRSLGQAFAALYGAGETLSMHDTINKCCEILRGKDDSSTTGVNKLCALECLGSIYKDQGRIAGSSFPDTVQVLVKLWKMQDYRANILGVLTRLLEGLGPSSSSAHKDIYKCVKSGFGDKVLAVRSASAECAQELVKLSSFLYSNEFDSFSNNCLRALDGSNYKVRCSIARLLGTLLSLSQKPLPPNLRGKLKRPSLDEALAVLYNGFVRGSGGFLKAGNAVDLLKSGGASRECRVGVTQTYVIFLIEMGGGWVERHLSTVTRHILSLLSSPKATSTHIDAVYSRKCISFILRSTFGQLLGESAQYVAAKHLCQFLSQMIASNGCGNVRSGATRGEDRDYETGDGGGDGGGGDKEGKEKGTSQQQQQHIMICAVLEIGSLVFNLNTAALPLVVSDAAVGVTGMAESEAVRDVISGKDSSDGGGIVHQPPLFSALNNMMLMPQLAVRLAGAWCLRCVGMALPSQLSFLVGHYLSQLREPRRQTQVAVSGYCFAVSALLGTVRSHKLGLPLDKSKDVFSLGQELIGKGLNGKDGDKMAQTYTSGGWALIGAFISLGSVHVKSHLRSLLTTWRDSFPHSVMEMKKELDGGTTDSWLVILDNRAGTLAAIGSLVKFCGDLLTPELMRRLMLPLDSALAQIEGLSGLVKNHGVQIKVGGAVMRERLYQALDMLPPNAYEGSLHALLRELVTEFTLTNNLANTTTSLLRSMCHQDDSILLGSWLEDTDQQSVEEQLQTNSAAGSGTLEHDPNSIYTMDRPGTGLPGPLPLGVAVIDAAIVLFGKAFPSVSQKHRLQLLLHFKECISQAKAGRQHTIQINIFTAFLAALKNLVELKAVLGQNEILSNAYELIAGALASPDPMLRCAAGEAMGRMSQVGGDSNFVARIAQASFECITTSRDMVTRTGHSLVLGCLHRYVGGMGSGQHLQMSVSILHGLTQDTSSPTIQMWALHALVLIADSGGPMFRNYVENTLTLMFHLLVTTPPSLIEVHQCLAKCLSSLVTTLGPELQDISSSMNATRQTCLSCCSIVQEHPDPIVRSAAIGCLQQLQMFAPAYVSLPLIVPRLCLNLDSPHLLLRRAAANSIRQFTQREPKLVWSLCMQRKDDLSQAACEGLEHVMLMKLDVESDPKLCEDLREILFSLMTSLAPDEPMKWLHLCNRVLSASGATGSASRGGEIPSSGNASGDRDRNKKGGESEEERGVDEDEDVAKFTTGESAETQLSTKISPRWPSKVFAVQCSRRIYAVCRSDPAHFDLSLARKKNLEKGGDYLVMHLNELVRTSFISATASVDQLKLAGYEALRDVIGLFATTPDPDLPGHSLLEQYQAQIGAALRPAFSDSAPHVTAMACQVCSQWLGSGVSRDPNDLKRVQQLLVSSLEKLKNRKEVSVYGEAVACMEALAVLKAWAELYIKVSEDSSPSSAFLSDATELSLLEEMEPQTTSSGPSELLDPHLPSLSFYWLAALKDKACLFLPAKLRNQLPPSRGGLFYSVDMMDDVKQYYEANWSSLLLAATIWLQDRGFKNEEEGGGVSNNDGSRNNSVSLPTPLIPGSTSSSVNPSSDASALSSSSNSSFPSSDRHDKFHLILGLAVQSLCMPATLDQVHILSNCLRTLKKLLWSEVARVELASDCRIGVELLNVVHRLLLTSTSLPIHITSIQVASIVGSILHQAAIKSSFSSVSYSYSSSKEVGAATNVPMQPENSIEPGESCAYALLQVVTCSLLRLVPSLRLTCDESAQPHLTSSSFHCSETASKGEDLLMILHAVKILGIICGVCGPEGVVSVLPPILHMLLSTLAYLCTLQTHQSSELLTQLTSAGLQALGKLCSALPLSHDVLSSRFCAIIQSALCSVLGKHVPRMAGDSGEEEEPELAGMDEGTRLVVVAVLLLRTAHDVCPAPSNLFDGCVSLFKQCLHSKDSTLEIKALQTCKSIFSKHSSDPTSVHFIHRLGAEVVDLVRACGNGGREFEVMVEATQVLELLLMATPSPKQPEMMALLIPLYISALLDLTASDLRTFPPKHRQIHNHLLQRVTEIGPKYPEAFRCAMQSSPASKLKLEAAVRASHQSKGLAQGGAMADRSQRSFSQQQPSIKLKMDFSNFK